MGEPNPASTETPHLTKCPARSRSLAMLHMDFEEITELHNRIAFALRMAGLKRAALDDAIAAAFHDVARAIEDQRAVEWERGKNVRNGFWRLIAKRDVETYTSRTRRFSPYVASAREHRRPSLALGRIPL
jgi:hypothetical protein